MRIIKIRLKEGAVLDFRAGQYVSLVFKGQPPRDYSIGGIPGKINLEFHVRLTGSDGVGAFVGRSLKVGDELWLEGPFGEAWFREHDPSPILAIGGGTGIVPIKSIVETALIENPERESRLYFGSRTEPGLYLDPFFHSLCKNHRKFSYVPVLSDPEKNTTRRTGGVAEAAAEDLPNLANFRGYISGPPQMVKLASSILRDRGMLPTNIHKDLSILRASDLANEQV